MKTASYAFLVTILLFPLTISAGQMSPSAISPHERAYLEAKHIIQGKAVAFDRGSGLIVEVSRTLRGSAVARSRLLIQNTGVFPFLNRPGTNLTLFLNDIQGKTAGLWAGPTTGGIIWNDAKTVETIAAAHKDPITALTSEDPRMRMAGAYYLSLAPAIDNDLFKQILTILAWGLEQDQQEINQASINALQALQIDLKTIAGPYHPGFKPDIKKKAAQKMRHWLAEEKSGYLR